MPVHSERINTFTVRKDNDEWAPWYKSCTCLHMYAKIKRKCIAPTHHIPPKRQNKGTETSIGLIWTRDNLFAASTTLQIRRVFVYSAPNMRLLPTDSNHGDVMHAMSQIRTLAIPGSTPKGMTDDANKKQPKQSSCMKTGWDARTTCVFLQRYVQIENATARDMPNAPKLIPRARMEVGM